MSIRHSHFSSTFLKERLSIWLFGCFALLLPLLAEFVWPPYLLLRLLMFTSESMAVVCEATSLPKCLWPRLWSLMNFCTLSFMMFLWLAMIFFWLMTGVMCCIVFAPLFSRSPLLTILSSDAGLDKKRVLPLATSKLRFEFSPKKLTPSASLPCPPARVDLTFERDANYWFGLRLP